MPQPVLHVLIAADQLDRWRRDSAPAPVDAHDPVACNAFVLGSLGPDLGLFPGGNAVVSRLAHTARTADLARALVARARTPAERAFAWGWLSHIAADVAIHPLVNAAAHEQARQRGDAPTLVDHVRVEVGIDGWFGWQHPVLRRLRLRPAFDRRGWQFVMAAYRDVHQQPVTAGELMQMQTGLLRFTALASHFASVAVRHLCWNEPAGPLPVPAATVLAWRVSTMVSGRGTVMHAYLNPSRPSASLVADVQHGIAAAHAQFSDYSGSDLRALPDYNLETGALIEAARNVA